MSIQDIAPMIIKLPPRMLQDKIVSSVNSANIQEKVIQLLNKLSQDKKRREDFSIYFKIHSSLNIKTDINRNVKQSTSKSNPENIGIIHYDQGWFCSKSTRCFDTKKTPCNLQYYENKGEKIWPFQQLQTKYLINFSICSCQKQKYDLSKLPKKEMSIYRNQFQVNFIYWL